VSPAPGAARFACRGIDKAFVARPVLRGVSLAAHAGEVLGVVRPRAGPGVRASQQPGLPGVMFAKFAFAKN
jgi:hypothetical protein